MITINIDRRAAFLLLVGMAILLANFTSGYGATREMYAVLRDLHFHLVKAPFEAAVNSAKAARDAAKGE